MQAKVNKAGKRTKGRLAKPVSRKRTANRKATSAATRTAQGPRARAPQSPSLLTTNDIDYLARINMELMAELWIARDRIAVLEELLESRSILRRGELDEFVPGAEFAARIEKLRGLFVQNILGAPLKHQHTVESLKELGTRQAALLRPGASIDTE